MLNNRMFVSLYIGGKCHIVVGWTCADKASLLLEKCHRALGNAAIHREKRVDKARGLPSLHRNATGHCLIWCMSCHSIAIANWMPCWFQWVGGEHANWQTRWVHAGTSLTSKNKTQCREQKLKDRITPSQLLPIMSFKGCSGDGEGRKDKGCGEGSRS